MNILRIMVNYMHILLMSCSSKKRNTDRPIPAIDLYNGVFFSVYKKAVKTFPSLSSKVKVLIISAKYGLIDASHSISYYDLKMSHSIALAQRNENTSILQSFIHDLKPETLVVVMGKTYLQSVDLSDIQIPIMIISGEIGVMLHNLKQWLYDVGGGERSVN